MITRLTLAAIGTMVSLVPAQEWPAFRGPHRDGVATGSLPPLVWSDTENLAWKRALPGRGSSSPVVAGDKVFVTCYSGYGLDPDEPGDQKDLTRHLICLSRDTGEILWDRAVRSTADEVTVNTQARQHGYATPTPLVDGDRVYVYFGRTGVLAFDLEGNQVWSVSVGTGVEPAAPQFGNRPRGDNPSAQRRGGRGNFGARRRGGRGGFGGGGFGGGGPMVWGSAASPLTAGDLLIVYAADASNSLRALHKETGDEAWKIESEKLANETSSPLLAKTRDGEHELVLAVSGEIWGLDPATGERKWTLETGGGTGMQIATPVADQDHVFLLGMGSGTTAIRTGALEDESDRIAWQHRQSGGMSSPALYDGMLYIVDNRGLLIRMNAVTGEIIDQVRSSDRITGGVYASPVVADGKVYVAGREGTTNVYSANDLELLASNQFGEDDSPFNASPAFAGDQIFLRSDKLVYCVRSRE